MLDSLSDARENCPAKAATELTPRPSKDGRSGASAATDGRDGFLPLALAGLSFLFFNAAVRSLTLRRADKEKGGVR